MYQIKINGTLLPSIYHTLSEAIAACRAEEQRPNSGSVFTEIIGPIPNNP